MFCDNFLSSVYKISFCMLIKLYYKVNFIIMKYLG